MVVAKLRYRLALLGGLVIALLASHFWWKRLIATADDIPEYSSPMVPFLMVISVPIAASLIGTALLVAIAVRKVVFADIVAGIASALVAILPGGLSAIWGVRDAPVFGVSMYSQLALIAGVFLWLVFLLLTWLKERPREA